MNLKKRISILINKLTVPISLDPDEAFMEFMTKMLLFVLSIVSLPFTLFSCIGFMYNIIPADTLLILVVMSFLFITGWWFANMGFWRIGGLIPPAVLLFSAVYGNYIGGIDAPAILLYVLAILIVAVLRDARDMYLALFISLAAYSAIGLAHRYGYLIRIRSAETAFWNRIIISFATIISIAFLVHFLIIQFKKSLNQARRELIERKTIETALRDSEKNYRELVQNVNSIILRMNTKGEVTFFNEFAEKFFGYSSKEIKGLIVIGTIVPETDSSGKNLRSMVDNIINLPDKYRFNENENITRDGKRVWITWANKPILDNEGRLVEILSVGNDITERKLALEEKERIQTQLVQAQKMEAIGTLTSGLAHDLNNMLGGIMGSLSLLDILLQKENFSKNEFAGKYIKMAVDSSKRASDMIHSLLLLSRKQEIKLKPVDINNVMNHVIAICRSSFPKSVSIDVIYGPGSMSVMADPVLIEQIFLNFCVNASHAMTIMREPGEREGGYLRIQITSVDVDKHGTFEHNKTETTGRFIKIEISDTGIGMDKEIQMRIFEPFFTMKKKEAGTGLGLSIAYGFITRLGGFIEIQSEINSGSSFHIYLPEIKVKPTYLPDDKKNKTLVNGTETILIIDDELPLLMIAEDTLISCGYSVLKAKDGIEGLDLYKKNKDIIDAVILDISMPFMSGHEVFEKIKEINESAIVILSSGFSDDERITTAILQGANGFIQKPYSAEDLSVQVKNILYSRGNHPG